MNIRELRKQKYWSQDQLAQMSGLSIRTIQRIERDQKAGLESLKALSAVFDIEISELQREAVDAVGIITAEQSDKVRKEAYAEDVMGLYKLMAVAVFSLVPTFIFALNDTIEWGFIGLMAASWGVILIVYALNTFDFFGDDWKRKLWTRKFGNSNDNDK